MEIPKRQNTILVNTKTHFYSISLKRLECNIRMSIHLPTQNMIITAMKKAMLYLTNIELVSKVKTFNI